MSTTTLFPEHTFPQLVWPEGVWQAGGDKPIDPLTGAARWVTELYVVKLTSDADHVEKP